ncbi:hypothetical protein OUZ56_003131 [Daphnia magna]|uniref:FLYWCH-type domain-containing protein n=1 Tax=Daphnia magna TaxID=35525 RepID=A0ABR0A7U0_9CRUS|nr:hypothetical protein OUZ56_003131 [Daphnia magna]
MMQNVQMMLGILLTLWITADSQLKNHTNDIIHILNEERKVLYSYAAPYLLDYPYPGVEKYTHYEMAHLGMLPLVNVGRYLNHKQSAPLDDWEKEVLVRGDLFSVPTVDSLMAENVSDGEVEDNIGDAGRVREIVNVIEIQGEKKNGKLYKTEQNLYHRAKTSRNSVSFRCRRYTSDNCQARLILKDGLYRTCGLEHCHPSEEEEIARIEFVNECCRRVIQQRAPGGLKRIFEQLRHERPEIIIGFDAAIEKRMQRAQQDNKPPVPRTFDEAEALLVELPQYRFLVYKKTLDGSAEFFRSRVSTATGTAFIFISMALLGSLNRSKQLQGEGTFKTPFPVAYVLMSEKTLPLYNLVMGVIIGATLEVNIDQGFACERIISDFEEAILVALQTSFPAAETRGYWFHYGQAIYKRACREAIQRENSIALQLELPETQEAVQRFYQYLAGYLLAIQTPARFSVSGQINRTNNDVGSWNRWFNAHCHGHRQNFWDFIFHLQECEETARLDFIALGQAENIRREALSQRAARKERLIIQRERDLEDGLIDVYEFLHQSMSSFEPAEDFQRELPGNPVRRNQRRVHLNGPVVIPRAGPHNAWQRADQPRRNPALPLDGQALVVARPVGRPRRNPAPPRQNPAPEAVVDVVQPLDQRHQNHVPLNEGQVVAAEAVAIPGGDINDEGEAAPANVRCSLPGWCRGLV